MAKIISQETYDEAFKENLELMDNVVPEARAETISQFEAMGVNLGERKFPSAAGHVLESLKLK